MSNKDFLPDNTLLPFFAYGLFRPGEIGYLLLEDLVDEDKIEKLQIKGELKVRDGLLIYDCSGNSLVDGYLLFFKDNMQIDAYRKIQEVEPQAYYTWNSSNSKYRGQFNVLNAKSPDKGIDEDPSEFENKQVFDSIFNSVWTDPFFKKGFKILHTYPIHANNEIESSQSDYPGWHEEKVFTEYLKIQMQYIFLWALIERFTFLSYGMGFEPNSRNKALAADPDLKIVYSKLYESKRFNISQFGVRSIVKSDKPQSVMKWHIKNADENHYGHMINYYYGLRSNIIHRGKGGISRLQLLECSFNELLSVIEELFEYKKGRCLKMKSHIDNLIRDRIQ